MSAVVAVVASVGLTGGIGSGKSTVAALLVDAGAWLVDTDAISRALTAAGGAALPAVAAEFGTAFVGADGALDRARLRSLVFADPAARLRLERLLHPLIAIEADRRAALAAPEQIVVYDVPLLAESTRWRRRVDRILVVDCETEVQVARVVARSGWEPAVVLQVIGQQASREARRAIADAVIDNGVGTTPDALAHAVRALWHAWTGADRRV